MSQQQPPDDGAADYYAAQAAAHRKGRPLLHVDSGTHRWDSDLPDDQALGMGPDVERYTAQAAAHRTNRLWRSLEKFYSENEKAIKEVDDAEMMDVANSKKTERFEEATSAFFKHSATLLQGLDVLGELHPAVKVTVAAFAAVLKLESTRRDNNVKAAGVKIQMQNLMCTLFQIRHLQTKPRQFDELLADANITSLMHRIAEEIKACGSDLSHFQGKKLLSRLLRAYEFEQCLAGHIANFAQRRSELQLLLAAYTTEVIHETAAVVTRTEEKVDALVNFFQGLENPREREAKKFILDNGGPSRCVENRDLLVQLLAKTGEDAPMKNSEIHDFDRKMEILMKRLQREMQEDFGSSLKKSMSDFEALIRVQNRNMEGLLADHASHVRNVVAMALPTMQVHMLIKDEILKDVWKEMALNRSVKAKRFILTFKDYYTTRLQQSKAPVLTHSQGSLSQLRAGASHDPIGARLATPSAHSKPETTRDDIWALDYLDVLHLDPIVEAIDEDFSGYISIDEVNKFAIARPKDWSLPLWFAYWAAGWTFSIRGYKKKIQVLVKAIYNARRDVLPYNTASVFNYLDSFAFVHLDKLLRATQLPTQSEIHHTELSMLALDYEKKLEAELHSNLAELKYVLLSVDKVTLLTGSARMEKFVFPLIYLLLRHHLCVIEVAASHKIHPDEMLSASDTLLSVFHSLGERRSKLREIFQRKMGSVQDQFRKYSFGMLSPSSFETHEERSQGLSGNLSILGHLERDHAPFHKQGSDLKAVITESERESLPDWPSEGGPNSTLGLVLLETDPGELEAADTFSFYNFMSQPPSIQAGVTHCLEGAWTGATGRNFEETGILGAIDSLTLLKFDAALRGTMQTPSYCGQVVGVLDPDFREVEVHDAFRLKNPTFRFTATCYIGGVSQKLKREDHFRMSPVGGEDSLHWKGEFWTLTFRVEGGELVPRKAAVLQTAPFEMWRMPPEALQEYARVLHPTSDPTYSGSHPTGNAIERNGSIVRFGNKALLRWQYAIAVVLGQVRQRTKQFYAEMRNKRIRFIRSIMSRVCNNGDRHADEHIYRTSMLEIHPSITSVWVLMAREYLRQEGNANAGIYPSSACASCNRRILFNRHTCITCISPLTIPPQGIDICSSCVFKFRYRDEPSIERKLKSASNREFVHQAPHTLLKTPTRMLVLEKPQFVSEAIFRSKLVKMMFQPNERLKDPLYQVDVKSETEAASGQESPCCTHCGAKAVLPCWACILCPSDTIVCELCEARGNHDVSHPLIWVADGDAKALKAPLQKQGDSLDGAEGEYRNTLEVTMVEKIAGMLHGEATNRIDLLEGRLIAEVREVKLNIDNLCFQVRKIEEGMTTPHPVSSRSARISSPFLHPENGGGASPGTSRLETEVEMRLSSVEDALRHILKAVQTSPPNRRTVLVTSGALEISWLSLALLTILCAFLVQSYGLL